MSFAPWTILLGFGSSIHDCHENFFEARTFSPDEALTSSQIHQIIHCFHTLDLADSCRETDSLLAGEPLDVVHSSLLFFMPLQTMSPCLENLGFVESCFFKNITVNFLNSICYGIHKFERTYSVRYCICPGITWIFSNSMMLWLLGGNFKCMKMHFKETAWKQRKWQNRVGRILGRR